MVQLYKWNNDNKKKHNDNHKKEKKKGTILAVASEKGMPSLLFAHKLGTFNILRICLENIQV